MTRAEHLKFCKTCINREMDMKIGLVCKLTGKIADFEGDCTSYKIDEKAVKQIDDEDNLEHQEVLGKLSPENIDKFRSEQNLKGAIFIGVLVGVFAALIWAIITVITELQLGIVAIAIGAAVGLSIRYIGKGIDPIFGYVGGIIAIFSCVLGNFLSIIGFVANSEGLGYIETFLLFDYSYTFEIMKETASGMDLIFYAIAAYEGYKFSFRAFTEKDIYESEKKDNTENR